MDKCREVFETLEDYQTSVRVFNERTRLDYEDFIHKQVQERQKLQLRFTPYTTKKGGYGVADLDHGLQTWQYQQKRIDELQARVDAANAVIHEYYTGSYQESPDLVVDLEQALKGGEV